MARSVRAAIVAVVSLLASSIASAQTLAPPLNLRVDLHPFNLSAMLHWEAPAGATPTGYVVEVGTSSGAADVINQQIGNVTAYQASFTPRTYYARVRAVYSTGTSGPSNEVQFRVQCPGPPEGAKNLAWRPLGSNQVQVVWDTGASGLSWQVVVSRTSDRVIVFNGAPSPAMRRSIVLTLATGSYLVSINGMNPCGGEAPTAQITVVSGEPTGFSTVQINEFDGFVELKNISNAAVSLGGWHLMTAVGAAKDPVRSATIPSSLSLAPNCTYLMATSTSVQGVAVDQVMTRTGNGYALVNPAGRILDSAAYVDPVSSNAPTPFGEGTLLPALTSGSVHAHRRSRHERQRVGFHIPHHADAGKSRILQRRRAAGAPGSSDQSPSDRRWERCRARMERADDR